MKKLLLVFILSSFIFNGYSQNLFTYGKHAVKAQEFLDAYFKNKTDTSNNIQALRNYLELYINFKLKVQAAKDLRMDTLPSLKADLQNFRTEIQDNYLRNEEEVNRLIDEAFQRSQKDIHTVYYFVKEESENADAARNTINEVAYRLKENNNIDKNISALVTQNSGPVKRNDLGFITVFSVPYEFENIIYALKPGETSAPYHDKKGWYIFKNLGERKAVGKITVAQILFAVPPGNISEKNKAKELADSVYQALKNGADFAKLALQYSNDRNTYTNGGMMPEFGTAHYDSAFEKNAFALKKDGDISQPFETAFGYHILRRISATPVSENKNDEASWYNLKQQVLNDPRIDTAKEKMFAVILTKIGLKKNNVDTEKLWQFSDSSLSKSKTKNIGGLNANTVLFSFNDKRNIHVADWLLYLNKVGSVEDQNKLEAYKTMYHDFINASAIANYASRLEKFDPRFKNQMDEFEEGNMLFEIMQQKVWQKASSDTAGLLNFFAQHQQKYFWGRSADAIIFSCADITIANEAIENLRRGKNWRDLVKQYPTQLQADSGRFELGEIPVAGRTNFVEGLITLPVINKNDGTATFAQILKLYPGQQQKDFQEARGQVINDYQIDLEKKWINQLRRQYPVKINERLFESLLKKE